MIMGWYRIAISAQQTSSDRHGKIQDQFEQIFMLPQGRGTMALLSGGWLENDMFYLYFTPDCRSNQQMKVLMDTYGAEPCDEPTRDTEETLSLLVGDQSKWSDYMWSPDLP
jgi:hypothetical protein